MHFHLDIDSNSTGYWKFERFLFSFLLIRAKRLTDFTFANRLVKDSRFYSPMERGFSSTLTKLTIKVTTFDDCLYLLDGRFIRLSTLVIDIEKISMAKLNIAKMVKIYI
jgi:hypothetical protein